LASVVLLVVEQLNGPPEFDFTDPSVWAIEDADQLRMAATRGVVASPAAEASIASHLAPLDIQEGQVVADIGCGSGYTLPWLSRSVGPEGKVYAVEYFSPAFRYLKERVSALGLDNVLVVQDRDDDVGLPPDSLDRSFLINVMHAFARSTGVSDEGKRFVASIFRATKPGGRVLVMDSEPGIAGSFGAISVEQLRSVYEAAGFETASVLRGSGPYRVVFLRPGEER
jgi:ubiquinone/menaquinone biosynthesis C-methylase UbiE